MAVKLKPFVFSIRGIYMAMFFDDTKGWEFRSRKPDVETGDDVLLYETAPTKLITATAVVGEIIDGYTESVWVRTGDRGGITKREFDKYFHNRPRAVALEFKVTRLASPIPLPAGMAPPQSWARWQGEWPLGNAVAPGVVAPP
jgi:predicted transcriptional regulator